MQFNTMQVSACATAAIVIIISAAAWLSYEGDIGADALPVSVDSGEGPLPSPSSPQTDVEPAQMITKVDGVSHRSGDPHVEELLGASIDCNGMFDVTLEEFLQLRIKQLRGSGVRMRYEIESDPSTPKSTILVHETTTRESGEPIPGVPYLTTYHYLIDWPDIRPFKTEPSWRSSDDPLTFMRRHWDAACNNKYVKLQGSSRGAGRNEASDPRKPRGTVVLVPESHRREPPSDSALEAADEGAADQPVQTPTTPL